MENINNDELDLVTFSDEEGNEFEMEVWDYFEHEGQEYAILFDLESEQDEDAETEVYIMKVTVEGEDEIFLVNVIGKELPFRNKGTVTAVPRMWNEVTVPAVPKRLLPDIKISPASARLKSDFMLSRSYCKKRRQQNDRQGTRADL